MNIDIYISPFLIFYRQIFIDLKLNELVLEISYKE